MHKEIQNIPTIYTPGFWYTTARDLQQELQSYPSSCKRKKYINLVPFPSIKPTINEKLKR